MGIDLHEGRREEEKDREEQCDELTSPGPTTIGEATPGPTGLGEVETTLHEGYREEERIEKSNVVS